jgi:hypothetical protein
MGVNRCEVVAGFALDFNRALNEQSFEKKFVTRFATIFGNTPGSRHSCIDRVAREIGWVKIKRKTPTYAGT